MSSSSRFAGPINCILILPALVIFYREKKAFARWKMIRAISVVKLAYPRRLSRQHSKISGQFYSSLYICVCVCVSRFLTSSNYKWRYQMSSSPPTFRGIHFKNFSSFEQLISSNFAVFRGRCLPKRHKGPFFIRSYGNVRMKSIFQISMFIGHKNNSYLLQIKNNIELLQKVLCYIGYVSSYNI